MRYRTSRHYVVVEVAGESGPPKPPPTEEEQLAVVKALPVEATIAALEAGQSPTPDMSLLAVQRNLKKLLGKDARVVNGRLRWREEDK